MHMLFRTSYSFLKKGFLKKSEIGEKTVISMRVMPVDLDILWHVNNGVYFSYMDFGRMDMIFRNGVHDLCQKHGWYSVVASETIKFKKSLQLWDKFEIETEILGFDDRYFFIRQKFKRKDDIMATALVKVRFLKRSGGTLATNEILRHYENQKTLEKLDDLSKKLFEIEKDYLG